MRLLRCAAVALAGTLLLSLSPAAATADGLAPTDPGPLYAQVKDPQAKVYLQSLGRPDGKDMVYRISGAVYAHVPADALAPRLRHGQKLFGFEGYNIRRLYREPGTDKVYLLTRELVFYTDPADPTKILHEWTSPIDGKTYPVVPVNNDAVNQGPFPITPDFHVAPFQSLHDEWQWSSDIPPRTDLRGRVGEDFGLQNGIYASWEMFDFYVDKREAQRRSAGHGIPRGAMEVKNSWTRTGPWVPFMCLPEKDTLGGHLVYHARSWTLDSYDELEPWIRAEVDKSYPLYTASPQAPGPNETSWTSFWNKQLGKGATTWSQWCAANGR